MFNKLPPSFKTDNTFRIQFKDRMKLWKRYIDDAGGVFLGRELFQKTFFKTLNEHFNKYELQLTYEISNEKIHLLDIEIFIEDQQFHTREYRKETACNSYVKFGSAHPKHCFKGIVKSQMYRLRRLCSRDNDFMSAVGNLRQRCLNSGYDSVIVDNILSQADTLNRVLTPRTREVNQDSNIIRWVILSGTAYEKQIHGFTTRMNRWLQNHNIKLEIVRSTGSSIGKLLFHNNVKCILNNYDCNNCNVCSNGLRGNSEEVISSTNGRNYPLNKQLNCSNCGIYSISCPCLALYTGKTTTTFGTRFNEHFKQQGGSAVLEHMNSCQVATNKDDFTIQFLEDMFSRGKYTLSEREYLWNERLRGIINIQKTLRS